MRILCFIAIMCVMLLGGNSAHAQRFCGGPNGGNYMATTSDLARLFHAPIPAQTKGSMENATAVDNGQCVAAPMQADALLYYSTVNRGRFIDVLKVGTIGEEYAHLVCADYVKFPTAAGRLANITDFAGRRDITIAIGQDGSGSNITYRVMMSALPYLNPSNGGPNVNISVDPTSMNTLKTVKNTSSAKLDCLFFVSTPNSDTMRRIDMYGNNLELVNINDPALFRLADRTGTAIYTPETSAQAPTKSAKLAILGIL